MTGGVEEHPERRTGLMLVPGRAELEHRCLRDVEVVDHDVVVRLLQEVLAGPLWCVKPSTFSKPSTEDVKPWR